MTIFMEDGTEESVEGIKMEPLSSPIVDADIEKGPLVVSEHIQSPQERFLKAAKEIAGGPQPQEPS